MSISGFVTRQEAGLVKPESVSYSIDASLGGVVIHWAGTPQRINSHADCLSAWRGFQRYHMGKNWVDIAYTMGVCDHGYVFAGRGVNVRSGANGTNESNGHYYAICWIGGEGEEPTNEAVEAMQWAVEACRAEGDAGSAVRPHSDFRPTSCCGPTWRAIIANGLEPIAHDPVTPDEPDEPDEPGYEWDGGDTYVIQEGDTLTRISQVVGVSVNDLVAWNDIEDPNRIEAGATLRVVEPEQPAEPEQPDPTPEPPSPPPAPPTPQPDGSVGSQMPVLRRQRPMTRGLDVRRLQVLLVAAGFAPDNTIQPNGTVDGIFGDGTEEAVEDFQRASGLSVDGIVGKNTWSALIGSMPVVGRGDEGHDVKRVQGLLVAAGFAPRDTVRADGTLDGIFGSETEGAVRRFQRAARTTDDGIVGEITWGELLGL